MANQTIEPRFIAVEGAIGAGKTSLVNLLGKQYGARVILENNDTNPFIAKFYEDREAYSFQTQIFFLLNRFNGIKYSPNSTSKITNTACTNKFSI